MFLSSVKHFSHYAFSCTLFKDNYAASFAEVHSFILAALHQRESCLEIKGCVRLQTKELIFVYYNTQLPSNFFLFPFFVLGVDPSFRMPKLFWQANFSVISWKTGYMCRCAASTGANGAWNTYKFYYSFFHGKWSWQAFLFLILRGKCVNFNNGLIS